MEQDGVRLFTGRKDDDALLEQYYEYFRQTEEVLEDFMQGQALHRLDAGVDVERFLSDASYKEDTVLGLCMTTEQEVLDLAIALAKKYNVSLWDVHMTQLQHLFSSELSTQDLKLNIESRKVMSTLKSNPENFVKLFSEKVLNLIDGVDFDRLILYYSLIRESGSAESCVASQHIAALKTLKAEAPKLNYHVLLNSQQDTLTVLGSALTADNLPLLAELMDRVPGCSVTRSAVFCAWCVKYFYAIGEKKENKPAEWVKRWE